MLVAPTRYPALFLNPSSMTVEAVANTAAWDEAFPHRFAHGGHGSFCGAPLRPEDDGGVTTSGSLSLATPRSMLPADSVPGSPLRGILGDGTSDLIEALLAQLKGKPFSLPWAATVGANTTAPPDFVLFVSRDDTPKQGAPRGCCAAMVHTVVVWLIPLHFAATERKLNEAATLLQQCRGCGGARRQRGGGDAEDAAVPARLNRGIAASVEARLVRGGEFVPEAELLPALVVESRGEARFFHLRCSATCAACRPVAQLSSLSATPFVTALVMMGDAKETARVKKVLSARGVLVVTPASAAACVQHIHQGRPAALVVAAFLLSDGSSAADMLRALHCRRAKGAASQQSASTDRSSAYLSADGDSSGAQHLPHPRKPAHAKPPAIPPVIVVGAAHMSGPAVLHGCTAFVEHPLDEKTLFGVAEPFLGKLRQQRR
jgi:hypothetical protein